MMNYEKANHSNSKLTTSKATSTLITKLVTAKNNFKTKNIMNLLPFKGLTWSTFKEFNSDLNSKTSSSSNSVYFYSKHLSYLF